MLTGHWHEFDVDDDGKVTLNEWNVFWEKRGELWGEGSLRSVVAEMMFEVTATTKMLETGSCDSGLDCHFNPNFSPNPNPDP